MQTLVYYIFLGEKLERNLLLLAMSCYINDNLGFKRVILLSPIDTIPEGQRETLAHSTHKGMSEHLSQGSKVDSVHSALL